MARTSSVTRQTLPQNYDIGYDTLFEDFETTTGWTQGLGSGSPSGVTSVDLVNYKTGSGALKIEATNGGVLNTKTISLNTANAGTFGYWVYIDDVTKLSAITIYLSSVSNFASLFSYALSASNLLNGWNFVQVRREQWTNTGSESWSNTMIRLRFRTDSVASETVSTTFDSLYYGIYSRPKVLITFDDGWDSAHTEGYTYMATKNLKGTHFVISSVVDTAGRVTTENLTTAYNNGWSISNHTATHQNLSTLTEEEATTELTDCYDWLVSNGFSTTAKHVAYPNGGYNTTVLDLMDTLGYETGSTIISRQNNIVKGLEDRRLIKRYSLINTNNLTTVRGYVDTAIANGSTVIINFHKLVVSPSASTEWSISDFQSLIDYIAQLSNGGLLDVMTVDDWYTGLTNPRLIATNRSVATTRTVV